MTADLMVRSSAILLAAWAASRLLTRATAATRHLLWHAAILAVLAAPLLSRFTPSFTVPVPAVPAVTGTPATNPSAPTTAGTAVGRETPPAPRRAGTLPTPGRFDTLTTVWLLGMLSVCLWCVSGIIAARRLVRSSRPSPPEWQAEADRLCERMGVHAPVAVRVMPRDASPLTIGWLRSAVVLPAHAAGWDGDRRHAVLLHELAHVRRHDCRVQLLAQMACAIYWFNPLIWLAASALRRERERACDDEVLMQGARASAYASHLLEIARDLQPRLASAAAVAMARPRELEGRLLAVLAAGRARVPARFTRWVVTLAVVFATVTALGARPESTSAGMVDREPPQEVSPQAPATDDRLIAALAAALDDPDRDVREKAALSLAFSSNEEVIPLLVRALRDPDAQVREKAALGLAFRQDAHIVDPLIEAARDEDSQVREKAIIALGTSADTRALPAVEAALQDPDGQVREKAVTALTMLRTGDGAEARQQIGTGVRTLIGGLLRLAR